jgi:hypothetical protein
MIPITRDFRICWINSKGLMVGAWNLDPSYQGVKFKGTFTGAIFLRLDVPESSIVSSLFLEVKFFEK